MAHLAAPLVSLDLLMPGLLNSLTKLAGAGEGEVGGFFKLLPFLERAAAQRRGGRGSVEFPKNKPPPPRLQGASAADQSCGT